MAMMRIRPARIKTSSKGDANRCSSSCSGCEGIGIGNLQYRPAARHERDRMTGEPADLCRSHAGGGATEDSFAVRRPALPVPPAVSEQAGGFALVGVAGDP